MLTPINPRQTPKTYFIDPEDPNEMTRQLLLDETVTQGMGTLLPESLDLTQVSRVLDLACGSGGWARNVAHTYPEIDVIGVDVSQRMVRYAYAQADRDALDNVTFQVMDILEPLTFPDEAFDVVNARQIVGFMSTDAWTKLLQECMRITRPGGAIRLVEAEWGTSNGKACEQLAGRLIQAMWLKGHGFYPEGKLLGITLMLTHFLREAGLEDIQYKAHAIDYSHGTEAHKKWYQNALYGYPLLLPFMQKAGVITEKEFDHLYQQALDEMQEPGFRGLFSFLSVWGTKSTV
ncbi:MAG TPA: methyltransferase domain-containing protein [Ktedonobacteraceae bacterium]|nr:methyltransferase domain-containing protein [Ktedonobacteraceae bacterium]